MNVVQKSIFFFVASVDRTVTLSDSYRDDTMAMMKRTTVPPDTAQNALNRSELQSGAMGLLDAVADWNELV